MFQVLFFPRLKEVSSWKTKKQGIISPNGGNRRGIFGSALKKKILFKWRVCCL